MVAEFIPRSNAASATAYYERDEPSMLRKWGGKGLEYLGMDPAELGTKEFNRLVNGKHPVTNQTLTQRAVKEKRGKDTKGGRVCLLDVTVNVPKVVSLLIELHKNGQQVMDAYVAANERMMAKVEELADARVRDDGPDSERRTGNLIFRTDYHRLARPVDGTPLPHHHAHNEIMNATWDPSYKRQNKFKALKMHEIMSKAPELQATFHAELRRGLEAIGFRTRGRGIKWGIEGVPKATVRKFSERRGVIETWMEKRGLKSSKKAALATRNDKRQDMDLDQLKREWSSKLTEGEKRAFRVLKAELKWGRILHQNRSRIAYLMRLGHSSREGRTYGQALERD